MLLCTTCSRSISTLCTYFSSLHSIPIQSTGNSTAFMVHHFCHNYSTRSLLLSLLLLLLPRFERNILFHATWSYAFTIRILSPYPLDTRRVSTRGGRGWGGEKGHGKVVKPLSRGVYGAEMLLASISSPLLRGGGCIMRAGERVL